MQTFLPYMDFMKSAQVLDRQRLGKQRVEVLQILRTLTGEATGWRNHPAALMWEGHEWILGAYGWYICAEWQIRGYKDTCMTKIVETCKRHGLDITGQAHHHHKSPMFLGDEKFHASHRSNLLRKDPVWYGKFGWTEGPDLPYVWPI